MKAYFDYWEDFWTRRVPESDYFRRCRNEQYGMGNPGWLERPEPGEVARADAWIADPARPGMAGALSRAGSQLVVPQV